MIRQPAIVTALTLAAATLAFGQSAQAGGGVRLNFGGPLGTFMATPTPGYGGNGSVAPAKSKSYTAKCDRRETAERSRPKVAQAPVTQARVIQARYTIPANTSKPIPVTSNENSAPGFLGRTLAIDSLPHAETVRILAPTETIVAKNGGEPVLAAVESPAPRKASATSTVALAEAPATCRKFIPAVGVTVTVACK